MGSRQQRLVLIVAIFASFVANLDGSIVTVALPAMAKELGGGLTTQEWVVNAYLLTLGSFMLVAGSLSDLFGRKKVLMLSLIGFGAASLLCAVAPTGLALIMARAVQGIAGAFLVPSSLALIMSSFSGRSEGKAIGTWTAWTVVAPAIGPLLGGLLVDVSSWRLIFAVNVIPIGIALWILSAFQLPQRVDKTRKVDVVGALLCVIALGGLVFGFIEQPHFGWGHPAIYLSFIVGVVALGLFIWYEKRSAYGMLPLELFAVRNFSVGNLATFGVYAALSVAIFLLTIFVQQIGGWPALQAGLIGLPTTILMFFLSPLFGRLAGTYGPRLFMGLGPIVMGLGFLLLLGADQAVDFWTEILPVMTLFGLGLSITVAPLTAAILGSISKNHSGIGSAINNAVARIAGLIGVAVLGIILGPTLTLAGFHVGVGLIVGLLWAGGLVSLIGITNRASPSAPSAALPR